MPTRKECVSKLRELGYAGSVSKKTYQLEDILREEFKFWFPHTSSSCDDVVLAPARYNGQAKLNVQVKDQDGTWTSYYLTCEHSHLSYDDARECSVRLRKLGDRNPDEFIRRARAQQP
jgi:hypothetical protein